MAVLTLLSDWSQNDFYLASIKGKLLALCPGVQIIDISHQVTAFSITQAAFLTRHSYKHFPDGSVHIIAVNHESRLPKNILAIKYDNHYFICFDNGILSLFTNKDVDAVIQIDKSVFEQTGESIYPSFQEFSVFTFAAAHLVNNGEITDLGDHTSSYNQLMEFAPNFDSISITGNVIYIDTYQNAITNINKELFNQVGRGRKYEILLHSTHYKISKISEYYHEAPDGEMLALFNSLGLLEVAQKNGRLAELLNLDINTSIMIKFIN